MQRNVARIRARFEVPDAIANALKATPGSQPLITGITFRKCRVAGKPVASCEDIGLRVNDSVVSAGVVFEP